MVSQPQIHQCQCILVGIESRGQQPDRMLNLIQVPGIERHVPKLHRGFVLNLLTEIQPVT